MDLSNKTLEELYQMLSETFDNIHENEKLLTVYRTEIDKRERIESLKAKFAGISPEELAIIQDSLKLSPSSVETEEKTKL